MLNPLTKRELGSLRDEIQSTTRLVTYLNESLATIDRNLRTAAAPEFQWLQGAAQALSELVGILNNQSPNS